MEKVGVVGLLLLAVGMVAGNITFEGVWAIEEDCLTLRGPECCCGAAGANLVFVSTGVEDEFTVQTLLVNGPACVPTFNDVQSFKMDMTQTSIFSISSSDVNLPEANRLFCDIEEYNHLYSRCSDRLGADCPTIQRCISGPCLANPAGKVVPTVVLAVAAGLLSFLPLH